MGRPLLGHKKVLIEIPAIHHDQVKRIAELRSKGRNRKMPVNQAFRDIIREGIDRLSELLAR
jgi:hypothetical protein